MSRLRSLFAVAALAALASPGCKQPTHFEDVKKYREPIARFEKVAIQGHERREYRVHVPADLLHPHFEGHWTFRDPEKPIDVFVFTAAQYDSCPEPSLTCGYFWSSITNATGGLGQLRASEMHIHPAPGDWVLVFYNSGSGFAARTEFDAQVDFVYFK